MSEIAIKVENLSKSYRIRKGEGARYMALRDVMAESAGKFLNQLKKGQNPFSQSEKHETFWALDDVSFEVKQGEVMGIIGRNGAGKSTLLKILSRITQPDKGRITLNGRVASLLEVGTGFHPELTGRENIYLSGAILGMSREEIKKRFEEIVDFAGVEKFLDTPVKRYSSGMYVRLGFAVAAHLETEILLVDEVLAVGDMEFQRRCIGKMGEFAGNGYAVLFVTHNLNLIKRLCENATLLQEGTVKYCGTSEKALAQYDKVIKNNLSKPSSISEVQFFVNNEISLLCKNRDCVLIKIFFEFDDPLFNPVLGIVLKNEFYHPVLGINNKHYSIFFDKEVKRGMMSIEIEEMPALVTGHYTVDLHIGDKYGDRVAHRDAVQFYYESTHFEFGPQKKLNTIFLEKVNWSFHEES